MSDRLRVYEERSSLPLLVLAVVFLVVYAAPVINPSLPPGVITFLNLCSGVIWLVFATDLAVRVLLAERRWHYLATHLIDVLFVVLPALRPLRVLRVFTAGQALVTQAGRFSVIRTAQALAGAAAVLIFISAVAMLEVERRTRDANINDFGDALWWAATTVTTVGYGDRFPVSGTGRLVAVALMLVGISLFGAVAAIIGAWFASLMRTAVREEEAATAERLQRLEERLDAIYAAVRTKDDATEGATK